MWLDATICITQFPNGTFKDYKLKVTIRVGSYNVQFNNYKLQL